MKNHHPVPLFAILALALTASFSNAQDQQRSEEQLAQILKRFPEADTDKDGKLTTEEFQQFRQSMQGNARPAAAAQPPVIPDRVTLEKDIVYLVADPFETKNLADLPQHSALRSRMEDLFEKEKAAVGYVYPSYADELWPADYIHLKTLREYHWIK